MENKFYRGGRPEMKEQERSERRVTIRFNNEEYDQLKVLKAKTKAKDLSAFIRDVCLEKPISMKTQLDTYQDEALSLLIEMRADLLRIGVNINQSSKRINSTTDYHDLQRDVSSIASNMDRIDAHLRTLMQTVAAESQPSL